MEVVLVFRSRDGETRPDRRKKALMVEVERFGLFSVSTGPGGPKQRPSSPLFVCSCFFVFVRLFRIRAGRK